MTDFIGRYVNEDDIRVALQRAGYAGVLEDQPSTRRVVQIKGDLEGTAQITFDTESLNLIAE